MSALVSVSESTVDTLLWHAAGITFLAFLVALIVVHLLKRLAAHLDRSDSQAGEEVDSDYDLGWWDGYAACEADAAKGIADLAAPAPEFPDLDEDRVTEDTGRHAVVVPPPQETTGYIPVVSVVDDENALAAVRAVSGGDRAR